MDYFHPGAEALAGLLARTPVRPEVVVVFGTLTGIAGGALIGAGWLKGGAALLLLKNILDKADGALARLTGRASRFGRFLDSLGDFAVSAATFAGIAHHLAPRFSHAAWFYALAAWALLSSLLQCSYFVYYQVSFIRKVLGRETVNREDESFTDEDRRAPFAARAAQRAYLLIYGWQDSLIGRLDARRRKTVGRAPSRAMADEGVCPTSWFDDRWNLRLASLLGLGTHIALTALACFLDRLEWYLLWAAAGGNVFMAALFVGHAVRMNAMGAKR
jgi:hypothetical protein